MTRNRLATSDFNSYNDVPKIYFRPFNFEESLFPYTIVPIKTLVKDRGSY